MRVQLLSASGSLYAFLLLSLIIAAAAEGAAPARSQAGNQHAPQTHARALHLQAGRASLAAKPSRRMMQGGNSSDAGVTVSPRQLSPVAATPGNATAAGPATAAAAAHGEQDPLLRASWGSEPSYASYYSSDAERPNVCQVAHKVPAAVGSQPYTFNASQQDYIPFVGTSVVRDSQLLLTRLYYSIDYPVKWFVVVVGKHTASGQNAIAYEIRHLLEYPQDKVGAVIITCDHYPAVSEAWNAIFQTFKEEPFGVYMARDTFWERGALAKLAPHGWEAAETGSVELGFVRWSNMGVRDAIHNTFMLTSQGVKRFGLFDENIYPAFCEDLDMIVRGRVMFPPLRERQYHDVRAVHGKRSDTTYKSGTGSAFLPDDPHVQAESNHTQFTAQRANPNCNYFMRKWGCPSELVGNWMERMGECKFRTPFNQPNVPHWGWHTNKALWHRDRHLVVQNGHLVDKRTNKNIFVVPLHYGNWEGYFEPSRVCRLSGYLGRRPAAADNRTMCL